MLFMFLQTWQGSECFWGWGEEGGRNFHSFCIIMIQKIFGDGVFWTALLGAGSYVSLTRFAPAWGIFGIFYPLGDICTLLGGFGGDIMGHG